ncbi:hypothetical protein [Catellatospora sp. NPDC049609]|uniref:hypothetical protein n=1 Tax=Catellatospora sp. NPDC049609 TaxID=3155505 RepID=UPI00344A1664
MAQSAKVSRSSLYRWMADDGTQVTIESATKIATAIGDDPANALRAAGSLLEAAAPDMSDPVVRKIMAYDVDDATKQLMLARHRENVELQQKRWLEDVERDLGRHTGAA